MPGAPAGKNFTALDGIAIVPPPMLARPLPMFTNSVPVVPLKFADKLAVPAPEL
jgi:hypothetical protein